MAGVTLQGIIKRYGAFQVVHGIDLDVADSMAPGPRIRKTPKAQIAPAIAQTAKILGQTKPQECRPAYARRHRIATLLVPCKLDAPKRMFNFIDDQLYDADLCYPDAAGNIFKVVLKKFVKA